MHTKNACRFSFLFLLQDQDKWTAKAVALEIPPLTLYFPLQILCGILSSYANSNCAVLKSVIRQFASRPMSAARMAGARLMPEATTTTGFSGFFCGMYDVNLAWYAALMICPSPSMA